VLAKQGFSGQQSDKTADPDRPDNLFSPPPGDPGAHGPYDEKARKSSIQTQLAERRGMLGAAAGAVCVLTASLVAAHRSG
jgi:hypothetical protein